MSNRQRTIVIVTEGASPDLLDRWDGAGLLPGFSQLRAQGSSGPLYAEGTPYEPPGLVSLLTGRRAADHGIYSYWTCHDPEYQPQTLTGKERRHPLMWHLGDFRGLRFACVGLFGAHPPEPLDGSLITYPMYPTLHACHPKDLQRTLARKGIRPVHDVSIFWTGQPREELLPQLLTADIERGRTALALLAEHDVVIVNLTSIDRCSHIYWQELELGPQAERESAVLAAYQTCDAVIRGALAATDDSTNVIVFSEIGFGPLRAYRSINHVMEQAGFLSMTDDGRVDWQRSCAFEAVQGTHGVNVNVHGRYKYGQVSAAAYDSVRAELSEALLSALNPSTGRPYFSAVPPREEVYPGEATELAPDLLLEPADWRYLPLGDPAWASHVNRNWQSAWHRRESSWAGLGPGFRSGHQESRVASPVDVSATICALAGREKPAGWQGESLAHNG